MPNPSNLEVELELTFLAANIPETVKSVKPMRLVDIYVPETADRPYVRLRQKGEQYEITKKKPVSGTDSSVQTEQTIPLERDEFEALSQTSNRRVEKDRYTLLIDDIPVEFDIFTGSLKGLVVVDFEFDDHETKDNFIPPKYCLADVTQELFIAGGQLAGKQYADIEAELKRFNYKALEP